jgi:amino acid adenylation domain-containing protein
MSVHVVVVNDLGQYSTWQSSTLPPQGWRRTSFEGSREECLDHIEELWPTTPPFTEAAPAGVDDFRPIHALVDLVADAKPDAVAVSDESISLTYSSLVSQSQLLAGVLADRGVGPGQTVAVRMPRSVAMIVVLLAISRTGGAALLLDPEGPPDWLNNFVRSSSPCLCVEPAGGYDSSLSLPTLVVTESASPFDEHHTRSWDGGVEVGAEHTACLVQTSGSTGMPKLVRVPHRTWTHAAAMQIEHHRISAQDRGAWLFPPHTNVSASVVIWPFLVVGAHLSIPLAGFASEPKALSEWLQAKGVTQCFAVAPLAEALARLDWPAGSLRMLLTGSDRVREWGRTGLPFEIANWYGANEVNIVTSSLLPWEDRITTHTASQQDRDGLVPIGRIWPGATFRVVGADGERVPAGEIGELLVGGSELALGYVSGRATADRFIPDVEAAEPGQRIYRTGDLVRQRADGAFEHCGRIDEQVKVNGMRVELAEVEAALLAVPEIDEAVVTAVETPSGRYQLLGYFVSEVDLAELDVRGRLATRLPSHMVPTALIQLPKLPRSQGDKIDRRALPMPGEIQEPETEEDISVSKLMAEVLGIEECAPSDNFFLLGGDSMLAATLARQISAQAGKQIKPQDIVERPRVEDLEAFVRAAPRASDRPIGTTARFRSGPPARRADQDSGRIALESSSGEGCPMPYD